MLILLKETGGTATAPLAIDRAQAWYGISRATAEQWLAELRDKGIITGDGAQDAPRFGASEPEDARSRSLHDEEERGQGQQLEPDAAGAVIESVFDAVSQDAPAADSGVRSPCTIVAPSELMRGSSRSVPQPSRMPKTSIAFAKQPEPISPSGQRRTQTTAEGLPAAACSPWCRIGRSHRPQRSGAAGSPPSARAVTRQGERSVLAPAVERRCPVRSRADHRRRSCGPRC